MADLPGANIPVWGAYLQALSKNPLRVKMTTSMIMFTMTQILSQLISKGAIVNKHLVGSWTLWGIPSTYLAHHFNNWMQRVHGHRTLIVKVGMDHILYRLFIMWFFTLWNKIWFLGGGNCGFLETWTETWKAQPGLQKTSAKLWPTLMILNYSVVPLPLRVLYLNVCQFHWALYLAFLLKKKSVPPAVKDNETEKKAVKD